MERTVGDLGTAGGGGGPIADHEAAAKPAGVEMSTRRSSNNTSTALHPGPLATFAQHTDFTLLHRWLPLYILSVPTLLQAS